MWWEGLRRRLQGRLLLTSIRWIRRGINGREKLEDRWDEALVVGRELDLHNVIFIKPPLPKC